MAGSVSAGVDETDFVRNALFTTEQRSLVGGEQMRSALLADAQIQMQSNSARQAHILEKHVAKRRAHSVPA